MNFDKTALTQLFTKKEKKIGICVVLSFLAQVQLGLKLALSHHK